MATAPKRSTLAALASNEQRMARALAERENELVAHLSTLIGFDTTAREPDDPPRDERALQEYLAGRLERAGARVDLWEPRPEEVAGHRLAPEGIAFEGRPQLAATFPGAGGGRSLLLNGHIDAVSVEPRGDWSSDPHRAEVRDRRLYGRGACDMKAGIACMTLAAEVLAELGVRLRGDLVVCTNTDEESSGVGSLACVAHGVRADAGVVTEPTGFDVWAGCRGTSYATVAVPGRPGHAELAHPGWREGGPVNAIEKAAILISALGDLRATLRDDAPAHPYLSPPDVVPTVMRAGEWAVTYPAFAEFTLSACFLPSQGGEGGWGEPFEQDVEAFLQRAAARDDWLAEHPPRFAWGTRVPAMEIPPEHPLVAIALDAVEETGRERRISGLDSWYDGATFTHFAGTPSIGFGPRDLHAAHTIDEYVPVEDLVPCARAIAVIAMRWCGVEGS
jgi:acetylornithine deacetylase